MTPRPVTTEGGTLLVEPGRVDVAVALLVGHVFDELAPSSPLPPLRIRPAIRRTAGAVDDATAPAGHVSLAPGGWWALVGRPEAMFPTLTAEDHVVAVECGAPGYVTSRVEVTVPVGTSAFPVLTPAVALRRPAVRLRGRVLAAGSVPAVPAPGGPHTVQVASPVGLVGFDEPLRTDHPAGTVVRPVWLLPLPTPRPLLRDARPGDRYVDVFDCTDLAPGRALELAGAVRRERVLVRSVVGALDPARPGRAWLTTPVRWPHAAATTTVTLLGVATAFAGTALADDVFAGEVVTFVANPAVLADGQPCRLRPAGDPAAELAIVDAPAGATDADGYYATGPVGRTADVALDVGAPATTRHVLVYDQPENVVDLSV